MVAWWCHPGDDVLQIEVRVSLTKELHQQAGVAEGPCDIPQLQQFQHALGSEYQLLVMLRIKPFDLIVLGGWTEDL